jgi:hypothetical protein
MLPNAEPKKGLGGSAKKGGPWWWRLMRTPILGYVIERWESRRRISELMSGSDSNEASYTFSQCLGHEDAHRTRIESELSNRLLEVKM